MCDIIIKSISGTGGGGDSQSKNVGHVCGYMTCANMCMSVCMCEYVCVCKYIVCSRVMYYLLEAISVAPANRNYMTYMAVLFLFEWDGLAMGQYGDDDGDGDGDAMVS